MCKTKKLLTASLALTILFLLVNSVYAHDISVPTNCYFGCTDYGTYISFNPAKTFDTTYRESNVWWFDGWGFQVSNGNVTVTDFFSSNPDKFYLTVSAPSGITSTSKLYLEKKGTPQTVEINGQIFQKGDKWTWDEATKILTITWVHASDANIVVNWVIQSQAGWNPWTPPVEPPPYIPPVELPKVPGAEFNYGIVILVGVVAVAVFVGVAGRSKPSLETQWKRKTRRNVDLSGKWRKKTRRK